MCKLIARCMTHPQLYLIVNIQVKLESLQALFGQILERLVQLSQSHLHLVEQRRPIASALNLDAIRNASLLYLYVNRFLDCTIVLGMSYKYPRATVLLQKKRRSPEEFLLHLHRTPPRRSKTALPNVKKQLQNASFPKSHHINMIQVQK